MCSPSPDRERGLGGEGAAWRGGRGERLNREAKLELHLLGGYDSPAKMTHP